MGAIPKSWIFTKMPSMSTINRGFNSFVFSHQKHNTSSEKVIGRGLRQEGSRWSKFRALEVFEGSNRKASISDDFRYNLLPFLLHLVYISIRGSLC